jgi:putative colanic acid biosynthesis acetyltransferase WcaF
LTDDANTAGAPDEAFRLDLSANRRAVKWTKRELLVRALWEALRGPLFNWSPRVFWGWRRFVLRAFGAKLARNVRIHPTVQIDIPWTISIGENSSVGDRAILYGLGPITIGRDVSISQYAHLCAGTHDFRSPDMALIKLPIEIGDGAWICADAFVGPGVKIGRLAVVGARGVVMRNVPERAIVAGNPAREVGKR